MKINLSSISHSYNNDKKSLSDVNLQFNNGITGLLGVNGAGKSTLLNILATVIKPASGTYMAEGADIIKEPYKIRKELGYLPQNFGYIAELSIYNFLHYSALLKGCTVKALKDQIYYALGSVNLLDLKDMKMKSLSGGMKQRVGIAQAIINNPKVIILDEPVIGLDPNERNSFTKLLSELAQNSTIIVSSHIIEDIENMCEHLVLLDKGIVQYSGLVETLIQSVAGFVHEQIATGEEYEYLKRNFVVVRVKSIKDNYLVRYLSVQSNNKFVTTPSLEDAFIYNTQFSKSKYA